MISRGAAVKPDGSRPAVVGRGRDGRGLVRPRGAQLAMEVGRVRDPIQRGLHRLELLLHQRETPLQDAHAVVGGARLEIARERLLERLQDVARGA